MHGLIRWILFAASLTPFGFVLQLSAQDASQRAPDDITDIPEGIVGQRIQQVIQAVSGDVVHITQMLSANATGDLKQASERETAKFVNAFIKSGGLTFYSLRKIENRTNENEFVVITEKKISRGWMAIVITLDGTEENRIAKLRFAGARPPNNAPKQSGLSEVEVVELINRYLDSLEAADLFSGVVLLGKSDEIQLNRAMGLASRQHSVSNNARTKFNLASMSKMFTAIAVLKLVQDGEIELTDTVDQYLSPEWLPADVAKKIQIQHLLSHTSGLGDIFNVAFENTPRNRFRSLKDYRRIFKNQKLAFAPGSRWSYSNAGMFLLGVVVEKVTGDDFFDHVNDLIFVPQRMKDTGFFFADVPVPNLATGYHKRRGIWINNLFMHSVRGSPAGGAISTSEDLFRFTRALQQYELLDEKHTKLATSSKPELQSEKYGYGFQIRPENGLNIIGHSGGSEGVSVRLDMIAEQDYTLICLANITDVAEPVSRTIREIIARIGE